MIRLWKDAPSLARNRPCLRETPIPLENCPIVGGASKLTSSLLGYPNLFAEKLNGNPKIRAAVDSSLSLAADILKVSKLPTKEGFAVVLAVADIIFRLARGASTLQTSSGRR